jgi:catechol 2,3-dioxygenase-like lactoylglutathione lyase family enzyme
LQKFLLLFSKRSPFLRSFTVEQVLALRPFVPAKDFALSRRFYQDLGFELTRVEDDVAFLKMESFSFILQNYAAHGFAEHFMMQMLVRDLSAWWQRVDTEALVARYNVRPPKAPAMQSWGMKVGFITDPAGVLWHIAEALF